jgi:hypothetical protein
MKTSNPRYQGKPLLRLLELYVLWSIGQLGEKELNGLQAMTPKLQSIYQATGDWHDVLAATMHFPSTMPEEIRSLWARNKEIARRADVSLEPQQFAELFVDQNFSLTKLGE